MNITRRDGKQWNRLALGTCIRRERIRYGIKLIELAGKKAKCNVEYINIRRIAIIVETSHPVC